MQGQLPLDDYRRYGRQMILDGFGLEGVERVSIADLVLTATKNRTAQITGFLRRCRRCWRPGLPSLAVSRRCWIWCGRF